MSITFTELMNEITLRESENRMNAHNLAIVLCPNLMASKNPARDVIMCALPPEPMPGAPSPIQVRSNPTNSEGRGTLGLVIKICIQRYYEIFDEIVDRSEALPPEPPRPFRETSSAMSAPITKNGGPADEEDDIDDGMLVMPIGPSANSQGGNQILAPNSWNTSSLASTSKSQRHRPTHSGNLSKSNSGVQSPHTVLRENANSGGFTLTGKARSLISIEKAGPAATFGKRGAITIGKGASRKSTGSAVEALGVTAAGFFTPPSVNSRTPPQPSASQSTPFLPSR
jgi:Rho GTPase-activating protein 1